jgi:ERCC4-type nuclease
MITYLIDSREQKPYSFKGCDTETVALKTGDYSIKFLDKDCSLEIAFERKEINDFVSCTYGDNRIRFLKELERSKDIPNFFIIIETDWEDIERHRYVSKINPNSVLGCIYSWQMKYNCHILLVGNRTRGQRIIKNICDTFIRHHNTNKKKKKNKDTIELI